MGCDWKCRANRERWRLAGAFGPFKMNRSPPARRWRSREPARCAALSITPLERAQLDGSPENGFSQGMKSLCFPALRNSCALAGALWLVTSCTPREEKANPPATNAPPVISAPLTVPPTNASVVVTNQVGGGVLAPEEAKSHVGEVATVRGKVFGVHVSQKGDVFINIGGKHPDAPFTAICFKQAIPTDQLKELDGKTISIHGKIKDYNGQIEIVLETADQILK